MALLRIREIAAMRDEFACGYKIEDVMALPKTGVKKIKAQTECPPPIDNRRKGTRNRLKRSKSRNLLERLIKYEEDVLRFMSDPLVAFTNNQGENDIRMTKVQQKISGFFRSMDDALISCRIRSYLSTFRKNGQSATEALDMLFE